jgi:hypothetical protein
VVNNVSSSIRRSTAAPPCPAEESCIPDGHQSWRQGQDDQGAQQGEDDDDDEELMAESEMSRDLLAVPAAAAAAASSSSSSLCLTSSSQRSCESIVFTSSPNSSPVPSVAPSGETSAAGRKQRPPSTSAGMLAVKTVTSASTSTARRTRQDARHKDTDKKKMVGKGKGYGHLDLVSRSSSTSAAAAAASHTLAEDDDVTVGHEDRGREGEDEMGGDPMEVDETDDVGSLPRTEAKRKVNEPCMMQGALRLCIHMHIGYYFIVLLSFLCLLLPCMHAMMQHFYLSQDGESITVAAGEQPLKSRRKKCSVIAEPIYQQNQEVGHRDTSALD